MHSRALSDNYLWLRGHFHLDLFEPHTITLAIEVARDLVRAIFSLARFSYRSGAGWRGGSRDDQQGQSVRNQARGVNLRAGLDSGGGVTKVSTQWQLVSIVNAGPASIGRSE
jgi:hypothetical protein